MKKRNPGYIIWGMLLALFACTACSTSQKIADKKVTTEVTSPQVTTPNEDQQKEFEYLFIEGLKQKSLGNANNAIPIFSRCLEIDPSSSAAMYELAGIHTAKGDFTSAMLLLEKAVSINGDNEYYRLLLARIYQQNKQHGKAASQYSELVKLKPDNKEYRFLRAALLASSGNLTEALNAYEALEDEMGLNESICVAKQQIYSQMGNSKKAYAELNRLIEKFPTVSRYYGLLADLYLAEGNREKAFENYQKILKLKPDDGFVHYSLANYYREGKDLEKTYEHLKIAFENKGLELESKMQMYLLLIQPEHREITEEQEVELLQALLKTHLDDERPRALYVDYLLRKRDLEGARDALRIVIDMRKDNYLYWERLLFIDNDLTDWQAMVNDSQAAGQYFPNQPLVYILQAVGLLQLDKYNEVLVILEKGKPFMQDEKRFMSQYYLYKAEAFMKLDSISKAFEMFEKVVEVDPENYMAMNNYAYYLSELGEKLERAEQLSGKVVQKFPDNATYLDTYAWILFKKKDYRLAKFYIESAISNGGDDNAVLIEHYGDILFFLDEKENALIHWQKSLDLGNESKVLKEKLSRKIYIEESEK